jgi:TPR repeat protein
METLPARVMKALAIIVMASLSACVYLPISTKTDPSMPTDAVLDSLIGQSPEAVIKKLGPPKLQFDDQGAEYLIYQVSGKHKYFMGAILLIPPGAPLPVADVATDDVYICILLTFRPPTRLTAHKVASFSWGERCIRKFWTGNEYEQLRARLMQAVIEGDVNAAHILVVEYGVDQHGLVSDRLRRGAQQGNADAAIDLAVTFDEWEPLSNLAKTDESARAAMLQLTGKDRASPSSVAGLSDDQVSFLAQHGEPEAQLQTYWNQHNIDLNAAQRWLCLAADQGHSDAQYRLGTLYQFGSEGVPQDNVRSWVWFMLAARSGHENAKRAVVSVTAGMTDAELREARSALEHWQPGECLGELPAVPNDVARTNQLKDSVRLRAERGDPEAQFELYFLKGGASPTWLCRAADQGYTKAEMWLGHAFASGDSGFPLDYRRALLWYRRAGLGAHQQEVTEALKTFEKMYKEKGERYACKGLPCLIAREIFLTRKKLDDKALAESEALFDQWAPRQCERDLRQTDESHIQAVPAAN